MGGGRQEVVELIDDGTALSVVGIAFDNEGVRRRGNGLGEGDGGVEKSESKGAKIVGLGGRPAVLKGHRRNEGSGGSSWLLLVHNGSRLREGWVVRV